MKNDVSITPYTPDQADALWAILQPAFRAGDIYTIDPQIRAADAVSYWSGEGREVWMVVTEAGPLGTYYIRPNQGGGGSHVCNCGFVTHPDARGRGIARAMLAHALGRAKEIGYRAMQFNFVIANNTRAVATWERAGFDVVGRLPGAFNHPTDGYVDALVMYKSL